MATALLYTTCEAIRGSLGLDDQDCPDQILLDSRVDLEIELDLDTWVPTHRIIADAAAQPSPTDEQRRQGNLLLLYCQWFGAALVANRPHLVLQVNADGKNRGERFDVDLEKVALYAASRALKYKNDLILELDENAPAPVPFALVSVSVPDLDPVTEVPD